MPGGGRAFRCRTAEFWSIWPGTAHQRCLCHAFCQVRRYTTSRPRAHAGAGLYDLAHALLSIMTLREADGWVFLFLDWPERWDGFLSERTPVEGGGSVLTHERLVKAQSSLARLVRRDTLSTYLDPALSADGRLPSTNNIIKGANLRTREMLRNSKARRSNMYVELVEVTRVFDTVVLSYSAPDIGWFHAPRSSCASSVLPPELPTGLGNGE